MDVVLSMQVKCGHYQKFCALPQLSCAKLAMLAVSAALQEKVCKKMTPVEPLLGPLSDNKQLNEQRHPPRPLLFLFYLCDISASLRERLSTLLGCGSNAGLAKVSKK